MASSGENVIDLFAHRMCPHCGVWLDVEGWDDPDLRIEMWDCDDCGETVEISY